MLAVFVIAAVGIAACTSTADVKPPAPASPAPAASASPVSSPAAPAPSPSGSPVAGATKVDALVGRWQGPEGTHLNIAKNAGKYSIEVKNLDGTKTFEGTAKGDAIEFSRNGKTETIKAATGAETGMKDFAKETNCLVITKPGEGFCKK